MPQTRKQRKAPGPKSDYVLDWFPSSKEFQASLQEARRISPKSTIITLISRSTFSFCDASTRRRLAVIHKT